MFLPEKKKCYRLLYVLSCQIYDISLSMCERQGKRQFIFFSFSFAFSFFGPRIPIYLVTGSEREELCEKKDLFFLLILTSELVN